MPIMPQYRSPYGQSIMELLSRQGDAQAQAAMMKGRIWGNAVQNIGDIGAQAYQQHAEQKTQQRREAILDDALTTFDPTNPGASYRKLATALGSEHATRAMGTMVALYKMQQGEQPDPKMVVSGLAALEEKTPGYLEKNWATAGPALAPVASMFKMQLDPMKPPEGFGQQLLAINSAWNPQAKGPGLEQVKTRDAQGNEIITWAQPAEGKTFTSMAPPVKPENLSAEEAYIRARFGDDPTPEQLLQGRAQFAAAGRAPAAPAAGTDPGTISAYVDDLAAGTKIWSDVPATIRNSVQVAARAAGVNVPTKRPTEKVLGELSDGANLVARTAELLSSPTGVMEWAKANGIPDWMTQLTGWGASAKANRSEFFMYMAETLKAIQGSRPSDKDMEWYMANLPRQGEAPQSAQLKIDKIKARLINQYNTRLTSLRRNGYALPGLELLSGEGRYLAPDENPTGGAPRGSGTSGNPYVFE